MVQSGKISRDMPLFIAHTVTTDNTNEMDRNGRYQFSIPEKHSVSVISLQSVVQIKIHKEVGEVKGEKFQ
jgi:hypothetical protein